MSLKFKIFTFGVTVSTIFLGCEDNNQIDNNSNQSIKLNIDNNKSPLNLEQKRVVELHNQKRNIYFHDSNLTYSLDLEKEAKRYADILAQNGKFEHETSYNHAHNLGENLYASNEQRALGIDDAMPHWFDEEEPLYNYSDGSCQEAYYRDGTPIKCGHYTQVIWQDTTEVGCATSKYKTGTMKNGYVYVCKYHKAGNIYTNGKKEKPYCSNYNKSDIYLNNPPKNLLLSGKTLSIKLIIEDRVNCTREDKMDSAISFNNDFTKAIIDDYQIFYNDKYSNTLKFDSIKIKGDTIYMSGKNTHILDNRYKNKEIYMNIKFLGETDNYYAVELEWNGLDKNLKNYSRILKAKLYK